MIFEKFEHFDNFYEIVFQKVSFLCDSYTHVQCIIFLTVIKYCVGKRLKTDATKLAKVLYAAGARHTIKILRGIFYTNMCFSCNIIYKWMLEALLKDVKIVGCRLFLMLAHMNFYAGRPSCHHQPPLRHFNLESFVKSSVIIR